MHGYTLDDFYKVLEENDRIILNFINEYITSVYPIYKPVDILPSNKSEKELKFNYRKKPKVGKAICEVRSVERKLQLRFSFLSTAVQEFMIRKNEFSEGFTNNILKQSICVVNSGCRCYGGRKTSCPWRQTFWIDNRLIMACPYPWIYLSELTTNDLADIKLLIDLQIKHMTQDPRDIKGDAYTEDTIKKCGKVEAINMDERRLDIDTFEISDYVYMPAKLSKYLKLYNFIPIGANDGYWLYHSNCAACGMDCGDKEYAIDKIHKGKYASVTIADPMTFSANRVWNYICKWVEDNKVKIHGIDLGTESTAYFARMYIDNAKEYMTVYVPLKGES